VLAAMGLAPLRVQRTVPVSPPRGEVSHTGSSSSFDTPFLLACAGEVVRIDCASGFDVSSKLGRALLRAAGLGIAQPAPSSQSPTLEGPRLMDPGRAADGRRALWRQLRGLRRRLGADATP
jgi:hypothetical protein